MKLNPIKILFANEQIWLGFTPLRFQNLKYGGAGRGDGTKSPPASSTYERVEHLHRKNILFRHWFLARAAARIVHKKSLTGSTPPGIYPVANDDQLTLISIYTHAMEWLP